MIENPNPRTWQDLQKNVCKIFNEIGLDTEIEKKVKTPRGEVEIDVFAIDQNSVDKIEYIVECKNWSRKVSQTTVHSFTTVMHEVGANIGFIISKKGLQEGAEKYTRNTNIQGLTFAEFQKQYFEVWWIKYFLPNIRDTSDSLSQYVEPLNSRRYRFVDKLPEEKQQQFFKLYKDSQPYLYIINNFDLYPLIFRKIRQIPHNINDFKSNMENILNGIYKFKSDYFRDLLDELIKLFKIKTNEFNKIFGKDIFKND